MEQLGGTKRKLEDEWPECFSSVEKKKGPRAPWSSQDMISAMLLVKQGMSITKAAQSLNIPRTTLRDRVTGKVKSAMKLSPPDALSGQNERSLASYYKLMKKQGYGKAKEMILFMAGRITQKNGYATLGEPFASENWWQTFCTRYGQPLYETDEAVGIPRQQVNEAILNHCYQQLLDVMTSNKYDINFLEHPELIYSCNEEVFEFDRMNDVIRRKGERGDEVRQNGEDADVNGSNRLSSNHSVGKVDLNTEDSIPSNGASGSCAVITCFNAIGNSLPPMFIHNSHCIDPQLNLPLEKYPTHRLEQDFFLEWFHEVFLKNIAAAGPCVLLYDGNNCFVTKELLMAAAAKEVIMFCIPASLSNVLQPMNLSIEGPFRESWKHFLTQDFDMSSVSRANFSQAFISALKNITSSSVICDRFRSVGIYPFFRHNAISLGLRECLDMNNTSKDHEREASISKCSTPIQHKDILIRPVDVIGHFDKNQDSNVSLDSNQNFMEHSGIITRPTMSNLNQPLNESPNLTQATSNEDDYRNGLPDVYHDDVTSSSDEGNFNMTSQGSTVLHSRFPREKAPLNTPIDVTARQQNHIASSLCFSMPTYQNTSSQAVHKQPIASLSFTKHSTTAISIREQPRFINCQSSSNNKNRSLVTSNRRTKSLPSKPFPRSTTLCLSQSSETARRARQELSPINALEEILGHQRLLKFQNTLVNALESPTDFDPLYPVWRSLKMEYLQGTQGGRNNISNHSGNPGERDATPRSSLEVNATHTCSCVHDYRTIVTPAGNVSVNKNATVIVIMPEKTEENLPRSPPAHVRTQTSKEPS